MNWQEVCERSDLQNLPFKIELNERGQIIMSPAKAYHSIYQGEISYLLRSLTKEGRALAECAIATRKGTMVAYAAWVSQKRLEIIRHETECSVSLRFAWKCFPTATLMRKQRKKSNFILKTVPGKFGFVRRTVI